MVDLFRRHFLVKCKISGKKVILSLFVRIEVYYNLQIDSCQLSQKVEGVAL